MSVSKSDYLKKYLSESDQKPKKKRKVKKLKAKVVKQCTLIDETVDFRHCETLAAEDVLDEYFAEDKPTVAAHIDHRPEEIKELEKYRDNDRWKKLKDADSSSDDNDYNNECKRNDSDSDLSPQRKKRHDSDSDLSPQRKKRHDSDSDLSPQRKKRHDSDSDLSPQRKKRYDSDSDLSPQRKKRHDSDSDLSPQRKKRHDSDSDQSPPRRRKQNSDSDQSPPRRRKQNSDSDQSPPRRRKQNSDSDQSPPRRRKQNSDSDQSPPRRQRVHQSDPPSSHAGTSSKTVDLPKKTLSGQKAGLSSAKEMKFEAMKIRKKNDEMFNKMDDETMGRNVATVFRDKKTGRKRDVDQENKLQQEEDEKVEKKKSKYKNWSLGVVQNKRREEALMEDARVASQPLARYKDDSDLHEHMKDRDRDGDPMAAYIEISKKKEKKRLHIKELPKYTGPQGKPNRYKILPGYRWDGVHRSIGFEEKIFLTQGNRIATETARHKWSTENM